MARLFDDQLSAPIASRGFARTRDIGFDEIDLGALPGVCEHVPAHLDHAAIASVADQIRSSGLTVRSINADVGNLNRVVDAAEQRDRDRHVAALTKLLAKGIDLCQGSRVSRSGGFDDRFASGD